MNSTGALLVNMDPPKHFRVRRIVSKDFTPLTERAERIVHEAKSTGGGDSVAQVACELPLQAIADAMPRLSSVSDPVRLRSGWINGIKSRQVRYN